MKIPPSELIARLRAAQGDPATAQLLEAAANRIAELEAQGERHALQAEGKHPAPCARHCESQAFKGEIRRLEAQLAKPAQGERQPELPSSQKAWCAVKSKFICTTPRQCHESGHCANRA